jgi:hypothetical protein
MVSGYNASYELAFAAMLVSADYRRLLRNFDSHCESYVCVDPADCDAPPFGKNSAMLVRAV